MDPARRSGHLLALLGARAAVSDVVGRTALPIMEACLPLMCLSDVHTQCARQPPIPTQVAGCNAYGHDLCQSSKRPGTFRTLFTEVFGAVDAKAPTDPSLIAQCRNELPTDSRSAIESARGHNLGLHEDSLREITVRLRRGPNKKRRSGDVAICRGPWWSDDNGDLGGAAQHSSKTGSNRRAANTAAEPPRLLHLLRLTGHQAHRPNGGSSGDRRIDHAESGRGKGHPSKMDAGKT